MSHHLLLSLLCCALVSCQTYYIPGSAPTVVHEGAGDMEAAAYVGTYGFDGNFSWAPVDHVGLMAMGSYNSRSLFDTVFDHAHTYGEFAAGLYSHDGWPFNIGVNDNIVQVGLAAGYGLGRVREKWFHPYYSIDYDRIPDPDSVITLHESNAFIHRYYLQLSLAGTRSNVEIHIKEKQKGEIDAGLLLRYAWVDHRSYTTTDTVAPPRMMQFMEYVIWGHVHLDAMALEVQFGGGSPREKQGREPDYISSYGSIGVRVMIDRLREQF